MRGHERDTRGCDSVPPESFLGGDVSLMRFDCLFRLLDRLPDFAQWIVPLVLSPLSRTGRRHGSETRPIDAGEILRKVNRVCRF